MKYTINAKDKILGRVASEAALLLRGKNSPKFDPARFTPNDVLVYNTDFVRVSGKKEDQKIYYRHSGYIGRLKKETFAQVLRRDSRLLVRRAVLGMLPKNKLKNKYIKHVWLEKGERANVNLKAQNSKPKRTA